MKTTQPKPTRRLPFREPHLLAPQRVLTPITSCSHQSRTSVISLHFLFLVGSAIARESMGEEGGAEGKEVEETNGSGREVGDGGGGSGEGGNGGRIRGRREWKVTRGRRGMEGEKGKEEGGGITNNEHSRKVLPPPPHPTQKRLRTRTRLSRARTRANRRLENNKFPATRSTHSVSVPGEEGRMGRWGRRGEGEGYFTPPSFQTLAPRPLSPTPPSLTLTLIRKPLIPFNNTGESVRARARTKERGQEGGSWGRHVEPSRMA